VKQITAETPGKRGALKVAPALSLILLALSLSSPCFCGDSLAWRKDAGSVALVKDGKTVWQYNYAEGQNVPYFSPVSVPGGADLTWLSPKDHPYHFALFFCWKYLNGVAYWETTPDGVTKWSNVKVETRPDFSAVVTMDLQYGPRKAAVAAVLTEKRSLRISPPAADGNYRIDWSMEFTAGKEPVVFDRTPPDTNPDGIPRGGYAGMCLRLARELTNPTVAATGDVGPPAKSRYGFTAEAADFSGEIAGGRSGIAFFDHPRNPRAPTRWYVISDPSVPFWFLNASLLAPEPLTLDAGKRMVLRYRVSVHPGNWDAARLKAEQARYARDAAVPLKPSPSHTR
jgi:hypothetical protein